MSWARDEFGTIELGDRRLNERAVLLAERLGQKPGASIPGACENWAETAAAYRFLRNEQVGWEEVLRAHARASQARIREHAVVLCIQDTTELDYNGQAMSGLGPLSYEAQRGLYLHPTYVVTPEREPLGVTNAWTWAREFKKGDAPRVGLLESVRWVESYERIAEQARALPETRHICIGDRESDILALLVKARDMAHAADYLIRCQHNRVLPEGGKLWEPVMAGAPLGRVRFEMPAGRGPKPDEYLACPPTDTVKSVRPWKEPLNEMISCLSSPKRSCATRRASLSAASFASAPEFAKNTRSAKVLRTR